MARNRLHVVKNFKLPIRKCERILLKYYSDDWGKYMPLKIIKYKCGKLDLHCQSGDHHRKAIKVASVILKTLNLKVSKHFEGYPTGLYYALETIK